MASVYIPLPALAANGVGAATDLSSMGKTKTFVVSGFAPGQAAITIEMNSSANPLLGSWAGVVAFQSGGQKTVDIAGIWFRARTTGYKAGTPEVNVGADDVGTTAVDLPVPVGVGVGASVDISALAQFKTLQIGGTFKGGLTLEVSADGTTEWAQMLALQAPGYQSLVSAAHYARLSRQAPATGSPVATLAGAADTISPPANTVTVQDEGIDVVAAATALDFAGDGVTVTDAGGGVALVTIPGGSTNMLRTMQALAMIPEQYTLGWQVAANFTVTGGPWIDFASTDATALKFDGSGSIAHAGPIYFTPDSLPHATVDRIDPNSWATALGSATDRTWIIIINSLDGLGFRGVGSPVTPTGFPLTLIDSSVYTGPGSLDLGGANVVLQPGEAIMLHRVDGVEVAPIWRIAPL